ncbi:MAG TPA: hypothetical protein VFL04_03240 [Rectinemataceae bacterium]|nr:hypothetical protein [Rectinemataceae bacterium]
MSSYLRSSLAELSVLPYPNGVRLVVKRQTGRPMAAARVTLAGGGDSEALALYLAALGGGPSPAGLGPELDEQGATLGMDLDSTGDAAISLAAPAEALGGLLAAIGRNLLSPVFRQADFATATAALREARRVEAADPGRRSAGLLRDEMEGRRAAAFPAPGIQAIREAWLLSFSPERLSVVVVGDLEAASLASSLASGFGAMTRGATEAGTATRPSPGFQTLRLAQAQSSDAGRLSLRAEPRTPAIASRDYAALAVALTMLDGLLGPGTRTALPGPLTSRPSILIEAAASPRDAMAELDAAATLIASGYCGSPQGREAGAVPIGAALEAYRSRTLARLYAGSAAGPELAARIALGLETAGDAGAFFRAADALASLSPEDVSRAARVYLGEDGLAWLALGDPRLIKALEALGFTETP